MLQKKTSKIIDTYAKKYRYLHFFNNHIKMKLFLDKFFKGKTNIRSVSQYTLYNDT